MKSKSTWVAQLAGLILFGSLHLSAANPRVLVYQKNGKGFVHDNLAASAAAIQEMGTQNGFGVDVSTNPAVFAGGNLKRYAALIFANSNNEAFDNDARKIGSKAWQPMSPSAPVPKSHQPRHLNGR